MSDLEQELTGWFVGRTPDAWFVELPEISFDREEILVIGRLSEPKLPADASAELRAAAYTSRIEDFREESRDRRARIANEAEALYGRKVSWGALCGERRKLFGFLGVGAERPFAVDVLARLQGRLGERVMRRDPDGNQGRFHLGVGAHRLHVAVGARDAVLVRGRLRGIGMRRAYRVNLRFGQPGKGGRVWLRVTNDRHIVTFHHSRDGRRWHKYDVQMEVSGYHHNVAGGFLSLRPGLYASGEGRVRVLDFRYRALP